MSAKPKPEANHSEGAAKRKPLPFVPDSTQEKSGRKPVQPAKKSLSSTTTKAAATRSKASSTGIPEVVSRRMVRRIALFSGIPTALGMSTFLLSYLAVSNDWFKLPTYVVLFVSLGWFGLGVLGVSYGLLSASWDEERLGNWLGFDELKTNWGRVRASWKANKAEK